MGVWETVPVTVIPNGSEESRYTTLVRRFLTAVRNDFRRESLLYT
jgi:hypothetical protein